MEKETTEEQREELEKRASICLQMLAMERELIGHAGGDTFPLSELYELSDKLEQLPAADPEISQEEWDRERSDKADGCRPRRRVEMAAGLAVQAYSFALSLRMEHFLNSHGIIEIGGPLNESIAALEKAAFNVIVEFGEVLRRGGDSIEIGPAPPPFKVYMEGILDRAAAS